MPRKNFEISDNEAGILKKIATRHGASETDAVKLALRLFYTIYNHAGQGEDISVKVINQRGEETIVVIGIP